MQGCDVAMTVLPRLTRLILKNQDPLEAPNLENAAQIGLVDEAKAVIFRKARRVFFETKPSPTVTSKNTFFPGVLWRKKRAEAHWVASSRFNMMERRARRRME
ncbi:hypothetical protein IG631_18892 [Alternaria alternata]|nr:hypothetical protein IG631_18892 [Alternaria alternata]